MLSVDETRQIKPNVEKLFGIIREKYSDFWGRLVKGDSIECITQDIKSSFRIALIIKCYTKAYMSMNKSRSTKTNIFGARIAIGIGNMRIVDRDNDLMDGEAIYMSGRALNRLSVQNKGYLSIDINDSTLASTLQTIATLTDALINNLTKRQSEIILYKLLGLKEYDIAEKLMIKQASVNEHSAKAKWYCIDTAVTFFEQAKFTES
jgi:hypothetical protein